MIVIMFLWKAFAHFLMAVLFYLHVKNILNLNSFNYCFFIYKSLVWLYFLRIIEEFISFPFYLSMPIDNVTWHARVGAFYSLKTIIAK